MKHIDSCFIRIASFAIIGLLTAAICGCGSSGWEDNYGRDSNSSGIHISLYSVSGTITETGTHAPVSGAFCRLQSESESDSYSQVTATDSSGNYSFSGAPAGNYVLIISAVSYVTLNAHFTLNENVVNLSPAIPSISRWDTDIGDTNHPYNTASGYLVIRVMNNMGAGLEGAAVSCNPAAYSALGYINATTGTPDWTASSTSTAGVAFFYNVTPGQSYTVTSALSGYNFVPLTGVTVIAGQISSYNVFNSQ
ncbi:MAG: carboxypeptidase regulatory-like domain-containing protein [Candidatus Xenobiia bacterium LiM19]